MPSKMKTGHGSIRTTVDVYEHLVHDCNRNATDYVVHAGGKDHKGHAFVRRFVGLIRTAIPDLRVVEVAVRFHAGDTIVWKRTLSGTHEADMTGIPPSGKKVEWRDMVVTRFEGGKIAEEWTVSDLAGQLLLKLPAS